MTRLPVRWALSASLDLIELIEFVKQDRPEAARKLGQTFLTHASRLRHNPRRGRIVPEPLGKGISDYRQVVVLGYRVIYTIRSHYIDVVAAIDSRRDVEAVLFQRLIR